MSLKKEIQNRIDGLCDSIDQLKSGGFTDNELKAKYEDRLQILKWVMKKIEEDEETKKKESEEYLKNRAKVAVIGIIILFIILKILHVFN